MLSKNKGITLVSLVITIIVMLILAGVSLNMVTGDSSVLGMATKTALTQKLATYQEEFEISKTGARMKGIGENGQTKLNDFDLCLMGEEVKQYIPSLQPEDYEKVAILDGKLIYNSTDVSAQDSEIVSGFGVNMLSGEQYSYLTVMKKLESLVKGATNKAGLEIRNNSDSISIAGITYGLGWYKIATADELKALGVAEENVNTFLNYAPYVVKYSTGAVVSSKGEAYGEPAIWRYTFNYDGKEDNTIAISNLLSGITEDSPATDSRFGDFVPTKTPAASGTTAGVIQNYYKDPYTYDGDGGVVLTTKTNILSMPIDQTKKLNEKVSVNITFKADLKTAAQGKPTYGGNTTTNTWAEGNLGGCLLAISDLSGQDICSVRIRNGLLTVITFTNNGTPERQTSVKTGTGYAVLDVKDYDNKYINLNIVAERGKNTEVYINGSHVITFKSGNSNFSYNSFTLGDLRSGRGMKFVGSIYNFGLYGELLTPDEVAQNWNYTQNQLGINAAGDKVK